MKFSHLSAAIKGPLARNIGAGKNTSKGLRGGKIRALRLPFLFSILLATLGSFAQAQDVAALSGIAIDAGSGKVLWQKDAETPRYPASTTKIMTALLLIERCTPDEMITAPADIENIKESSMHLKPYEQVRMIDMLYALMLRSANDGAVAVADHISGSVPAFVELMNERAKQIGCTHTHFDNPNGLNDKNHTISAHDLALIAREAMKYPVFREVVKTKRFEIVRSVNTADRLMVNKNKWLFKDPSADGVKTGYTVPAGHTYVGSATRSNFQVITALMHSDHWQSDHKSLLDYSFSTYEARPVAAAGTPLASDQVQGGTFDKVSIGLTSAVREVVKKNAGAVQTSITVRPLVAPVSKGQVAGEMTILDPDGFRRVEPLVTLSNVPKQSFAGAISRHGSSGLSFGVIGGSLVVGAAFMRRKSRRMRFNGRSQKKYSG